MHYADYRHSFCADRHKTPSADRTIPHSCGIPGCPKTLGGIGGANPSDQQSESSDMRDASGTLRSKGSLRVVPTESVSEQERSEKQEGDSPELF